MKKDIRLFIEGKELDFTTDPKILFNYKITDINNPTVVKNSFSKSVEIEGTPRNNDVFQNIWNLERIQWSGINFNPIKKAEFVIYVNSEIYEKGYAKLDSVTSKDGKYTYTLTLFGGLGEFFFNLTYKDDDAINKKSLSDLNFANRETSGTGLGVYSNSEPDLNFKINKETLWDAWNTITGNPDAVYDESEVNRPVNYLYDEKWEILNFAPSYNGIPDDFDSSRCIINKSDMPIFSFSETDNGKTFTDYRGYITGEQPNDELTEWETFDLRSYLQRPVVSMRRIIEAACNPINNGGYEVFLDPTFFNSENPYYYGSYLTLPMLRENIEGGETITSTEGQLVEIPLTGFNKDWAKLFNVQYDIDTISKIVNVNLGLNLELSTTGTANQLYLYRKFNATASQRGDIERVKSIESIGSVCVQLAAFDALGKCVASSNVYYVTDSKASGKAKFNEVNWNGSNGWAQARYNGAGQGGGVNITYRSTVPIPGVTNVYGSFKRNSSGKYELVDDNGNPIILNFNFATETPYSKLEMSIQYLTDHNIEYYNPYKWWKSQNYNSVHRKTDTGSLMLYLYDGVTYGGDISINNALNRNSYTASPIMSVNKFSLVTKDYSEFFSDTYVRKQNILRTDNSVSDYLISYAKMFGLYFYQNPAEEATDTNLCPKGRIHILTRDSYYTNEVVDLNQYIDRSKTIDMVPTTIESKWINFNVEQVDSEANIEHKNKYGYDYGYQKVNTGYNFNSENKALLDKVVFKGGVEVLETSKYYQIPVSGYPAYGWNGFKYTLYNVEGDDINTLELDTDLGVLYRNSINPNSWYDTDAFKKPQFHDKDNSSTDGKDVLLFYNGNDWYEDRFNYWITDDIEEMIALNDSNPCWIMTRNEFDVNGKRIAYKINNLPIFQRNIVYGDNNIIIHSWDFGNPYVTFVRDMFVGRQSSIYYKCWENYISDLYSQDNRTLNAYVTFDERPNSGWLRKFYWFDNSIWRINAIKDWNISSYESTAVEFVKVIDANNYSLTPITDGIIGSFTFPDLENIDDEYDDSNIYRHYYRMGVAGGYADGYIDFGGTGIWCFGDGEDSSFSVEYEGGNTYYYQYADYMTPTNECGEGDAVKRFYIEENNSTDKRTYSFVIQDGYDRYYKCYIVQDGKQAIEEKLITITPNSIIGPAEGGTVQVQVYYQNRGTDTVSFDYNESEEYMYFDYSLSGWSGDYATLSITFEPNTTTEMKTGAYLSLQALNADASASITIIQEAGTGDVFTPNFELSVSNLKFQNTGGLSIVTIKNNTTDSIKFGNLPTWITPSIDGNEITVSVGAYYSSINRVAVFDVIGVTEGYDNVVKSIQIIQYGLSGTLIVPYQIEIGGNLGDTSETVTVLSDNLDYMIATIRPLDRFKLNTISEGTTIKSYYVTVLKANDTLDNIIGEVSISGRDTNGNMLFGNTSIIQKPSRLIVKPT